MCPQSSDSDTPSVLRWPNVPAPGPDAIRRMVSQLEKSQWQSTDQLLENQLKQLSSVLNHAYATVPLYRERMDATGFTPNLPLTVTEFRDLPRLLRQDIQQHHHSLFSSQCPETHGRHYKGKTSGSTGQPIHFRGTVLVNNFWKAITVRDHLWQRRDFAGTYAAIRALVQNDRRYPNWGSATAGLHATGPSYSLDIRNDLGTQARWIRQIQPTYLQTYPSNLRGLLEYCRSREFRFPGLRQVCTVSETLDPTVRELCHDVLGVPVSDCYSAEETGYIALQCPQSGLYHIQSEYLLVEILNDTNTPCAPGEAGRVVVTTLANFAMPLIRYEIMDYAIAGPTCPCGRGLPTLSRILGRTRNLVTLPDGRRYWPLFGFHRWMDAFPIQQMQLIQKNLASIEVRYVSSRLLVADEQRALGNIIHQALRHPFPLTFTRMQEIPRSASGKFEDFISEL